MEVRANAETVSAPIDHDRILHLWQLLGATAFTGLLAQLEGELSRALIASRTVSDQVANQHVLHRLQGSSSALGLVETAATLALAQEHMNDMTLAAVETAFGRTKVEIATRYPDLAAAHLAETSKR